ncbi:chitin-binding type-2 domain-containing protein, partial [Nephila pilipes]
MHSKSNMPRKILSELSKLNIYRSISDAKQQQCHKIDYPTYWEMDLPQTRFTCKNKVNGGYYADIETECQMYHVCHRNKDGVMRSSRFLCGNGTVFDQRHLVCQDYRKVRRRCRDSEKYYNNVATLLEQLEARL